MSVTVPTPLPPTTPPPGDDPEALPPLPDDVRSFCERHGLTAYLPITFRLIREEFAPVGEIAPRVLEDPEADHASLVLNIPVARAVPTVLECFNRFLERWIPVTPPDVRMRIAVIWTFRP
jgi:hypothetical protein